MDTHRLAHHLQRPEVQQMILGRYRGPYSLGVTSDPKDTDRPAISVRIAGDDTSAIPCKVTLDGQDVTVVVKPHFAAPRPL